MADVFLSYTSKDREVARSIAGALSGRGLSVWWDRDIVTGETFDHAIERELEGARSIVVLWSQNSVSSEWVKNEAAAAAERGILLPASLDDSKLPFEFRRRQTADLRGWSGDPSHEGFQSLCRGIDKLLGEGGSRPLQPAEPMPPKSRRNSVIAAIVVAIVAVVAYLWFGSPGSSPPEEATEPDLAALVVGNYFGDIYSDSKGSSRSGVTVTITRLSADKVRVTSKYARIGTVDIEVQRRGNEVLNAGGETLFGVDLGAKPPTLTLNPRMELAYHGVRR